VTLVEKLQSTQDLRQRSQTRGQQAAWLKLTWTFRYLSTNIQAAWLQVSRIFKHLWLKLSQTFKYVSISI